MAQESGELKGAGRVAGHQSGRPGDRMCTPLGDCTVAPGWVLRRHQAEAALHMSKPTSCTTVAMGHMWLPSSADVNSVV